ncbi:hypothetical protein ABTK33_20780, partial [Acinetobacter baumannii]
MPKPLPIIARLALPLMLTACAQTVRVAPTLPVCSEPITLPKSMTDPLPLPSWFVVPKTTTTSLSMLPP